MIGPGFRDHHHHGVRQGAAGQDQQFQHVVEHGRIAAVRIDDGQDLVDVFAEGIRLEQGFAGAHPVDVAPQGVDLAVVRDVTVRVGTCPTRESVGAEPGMDQRQTGLHARVFEVEEVLVNLLGQEHALVHQSAAGKAANVPVTRAILGRTADFGIGPLADDVQLSLEGQIVLQLWVLADEHLSDVGFGRLGRLAERTVVGRHRAPSQEVLAFGLDNLLERHLQLAALPRISGEVHHAHAVLASRRQGDTHALGFVGQKLVRHLDEDAGSVTRIGLAAAGAAMIQVSQDLEPLLDHRMGLGSLDVGDKADAASVVFEVRPVE